MKKLGYAVLASKMFVDVKDMSKGLATNITEVYCHDNIGNAWLDRPKRDDKSDDMVLTTIRYTDERRAVIFGSSNYGGDIVWVEAIEDIQFVAYVNQIQ